MVENLFFWLLHINKHRFEKPKRSEVKLVVGSILLFFDLFIFFFLIWNFSSCMDPQTADAWLLFFCGVVMLLRFHIFLRLPFLFLSNDTSVNSE